MIDRFQCSKIVILITLLVLSTAGFTQNPSPGTPIMITTNSYLEDVNGKEIPYEAFMNKMNTGKFTLLPIYNKDEKVQGYKLSSREESSTRDLSGMNRVIKLESTEITETVKVDFIYRDYIFVPVDFFNGEKWFSQWMLFDTGTFIPVILLPETAVEVGLLQKLKIGTIEVLKPGTGSFEFNEILRKLIRYPENYPDEFGGMEITGIAGLPLLANYIISLDMNQKKMSLRPLESEQRTLYDRKPVASVKYRSDLNNIWFPISINGQEGYAHLDTGNPYFDIESSVLSQNHELNSFKIGESEIGERFDKTQLRIEDFSGRYGQVGLPVISAFGNKAASSFVITIDPREQRLYFEELQEN